MGDNKIIIKNKIVHNNTIMLTIVLMLVCQQVSLAWSYSSTVILAIALSNTVVSSWIKTCKL